jgi:nucleoside-diphosphate-sugar epimerase
MNILVTGGAGFIGSNLVKVIIQSLSYQLVAYIDKSKIENIK